MPADRVGGERLGVLTVGWTDPMPSLDDRTAELVGLAADEAAHALQRRAVRRLESAALNDALTGVPNRRAFDEELPRALARARRSGEPLALAYMDLNGFKELNDRDGHAAGDRVLKEVAAGWHGAPAPDRRARAGRALIVEDARRHPLLRDNPAIVERDLIAYAGIPLVDADDNVLGVLCAIDNKPRRWREEDVATLRRLAERAVTQLIAQTA